MVLLFSKNVVIQFFDCYNFHNLGINIGNSYLLHEGLYIFTYKKCKIHAKINCIGDRFYLAVWK